MLLRSGLRLFALHLTETQGRGYTAVTGEHSNGISCFHGAPFCQESFFIKVSRINRTYLLRRENRCLTRPERVSVSHPTYSNLNSLTILPETVSSKDSCAREVILPAGTEPRKQLWPHFASTKHSNESDLISILTISHKCTTWHFSNNHFHIIHSDTSHCDEKQNE